MGVTKEPMIEFEDIAMLSPLHSTLRFFDFLLKIIYHLHAKLFIWSDDKRVLSDRYEALKYSKDTVRNYIKEHTNVAVDVPDATGRGGTSTTGNVVHTLLKEEKIYQYWYPKSLLSTRKICMNVFVDLMSSQNCIIAHIKSMCNC